MSYRLLVTGSRDWHDRKLLRWALDEALKRYPGLTLVHGACPSGADLLANEWALDHNLKVESYPAEWGVHGKAAGPIRNSLMVDKGADLCLAFPLGTSIGTWDCANKAKAAGIRTVIFLGGKYDKHFR